MNSRRSPTSQAVDLWRSNADAWISAVRESRIESRRVRTDQAVIDEVTRLSPTSVLDIGCGEGWLCRALDDLGIKTFGIDPIDRMIYAAAKAGGHYVIASVSDLARGSSFSEFDVWVCNFSLFAPEDAEMVAKSAALRLSDAGALVIQTLHASATPSGKSEPDGWQHGSWIGCGPDFKQPIPWYYRSEAGWRTLFANNGFSSVKHVETQHPDTGRFLSSIYVATKS
jgi:2-polyprenyl-3-methyl-5-hydroxy-6-metoxy-1,4-benzoquinol methylase